MLPCSAAAEGSAPAVARSRKRLQAITLFSTLAPTRCLCVGLILAPVLTNPLRGVFNKAAERFLFNKAVERLSCHGHHTGWQQWSS